MVPWLPIATPRLKLREFRGRDEADLHALGSDPEVVRYAVWGPNDASMTRAYLAYCLDEQRRWPGPSLQIAVDLQAGKCLIGTLSIGPIDRTNRSASIGYTIHRRYWGQGYATEAAGALLHAAFRTLDLHRVFATCDVRNTGSYKVMERLGMRREGQFQKDIWQKGEWRDSYLYAILSEEWQTP